LPQDDSKQRCPDITQAKSILGWEPKVGWKEGLQVTIDYFTKQFAMNPRVGALASERKARRADHSKPLWPSRISAAHVWEIESNALSSRQ
jgi:hypothetical protein